MVPLDGYGYGVSASIVIAVKIVTYPLAVTDLIGDGGCYVGCLFEILVYTGVANGVDSMVIC